MGRLLLPFTSVRERRPLFSVGYQTGAQWGSLNASEHRVGFLFRSPTGGDTLTKIWADHQGSAGTLTDIGEWTVYAVDSNFNPTGSALATKVHTPSLSYVGVSLDTPLTLASATVYACVLRNRASELSLSPASNYVSYVWGPMGYNYRNETYWIRSGDSGSTWTISGTLDRAPMFAPEFGSAGHAAFPIVAGSQITTRKLYNDTTNVRWNGTRYMQPWDGVPIEAYAQMISNGSASFPTRCDIFDETGNLVVSSTECNGNKYRFLFDTDVLLKRGKQYTWAIRAVENPIGSSSVYWTMMGAGSSSPTTFADLVQGRYSDSGTSPSWTNTSPFQIGGLCEAVEDRPRIWRLGAS